MARIALVHGLGGTAATMRPLAEALVGHHCSTPTLPGHGGTLADLRAANWEEWLEAVPDADVLIGQSMGAALCLATAQRPAQVVVAINCPAPDLDAAEGVEWRLSRGHDLVEGMPLTAVRQMVGGILRIDLAAVRSRILLVNSAKDDVVDPASAEILAAALPTPPGRLLLPNSGHEATMGPDLDLLVAAILGQL